MLISVYLLMGCGIEAKSTLKICELILWRIVAKSPDNELEIFVLMLTAPNNCKN
jgi:hypothetical protein